MPPAHMLRDVVFFFLLVHDVAQIDATKALSSLSSLDSEAAVLSALGQNQYVVGEGDPAEEAADVEQLVHRGWHDAVRSIISKSQKGSEELAQRIAAQVRAAIQSERNRLDDLTRALDRNYGKTSNVNPAMQWAQNSSHVFLSVKFAQRWNAPGALEIENETVLISDCCFNFTAFGEHSFIRRKYHLSFELFLPAAPKASSWSLASVGRMTVTIAKGASGNWPRLFLNADDQPKNLGIWRDMRDKWKSELSKFALLTETGATKGTGEQKDQADKTKAKKTKEPKKKRKRDSDEDEDDAIDREVELLSECDKSTYAGTPVAELCPSVWKEVVEEPKIKRRSWLVELYASQGEGDSSAMGTLMPVWKRLADVFPSTTPGGRVGALDCSYEKEFCATLGASLTKLPEIRRFPGTSPRGDIWKDGVTSSIEKLAEFGAGARSGDRNEL